MKSILRIGSLRSPPPIRLRRTSPRESVSHDSQVASLPYESCFLATPSGGQNKTPQNLLFISISTISTGCCATSKRGKGGGASHQRGNAFPTPAGRLYGFRRQRRYKKWRRRRRPSPAQRYYITPEGESTQPACKASADHRQNPWRPGPKARRRHQPHAHQGVSTFGNTASRRFFTKKHGFPDAKGGI